MNIRSLYAIFMSLCITQAISAAIVITGNIEGPTSFDFSLGSYARSKGGNAFYVGALTDGTGGIYSLTGVGANMHVFEPFALETVTINNIADQPNPLFNKAISQISTFETQTSFGREVYFPMAVAQDSPADLFLVRDKRGDNVTMLAIANVKDATGATTQGIIDLEPFATEAILATVLPAATAQFGDPGSGVAVIKIEGATEGECTLPVLVQINADPASVLPSTTSAASPLDVTSASLKIGNDLVSIANAVDMHFSSHLRRFYVALQVQGGAGVNDGARALAIGYSNITLSFLPIAPDAVFTGADKIVGATGANTQVSINQVRTMYTTTGLDYLVVVGSNGSPATTQRFVYALPVVNTLATGSVDNAIQGALANVNADPVVISKAAANNSCQNAPQMVVGRAFVQAATQPDQVYTTASPQALVGGAQLPYGDITDINVIRDAVYVSVADGINNENPGIFYSQALFDDRGVIAAWTPWKRFAGTSDKAYALSYEPMFANTLWLTGASTATIQTAKRTLWGSGAVNGLANLVTVIQQLMPEASGGVQGFFNLPPVTPGLFDISLFIATGLKQVVLVESGQVIGGALIANTGDFQTDMQQFTSGEITTNFPVGVARVVSISGGVLDDLGSITAATLGVNTTTQQGYLFVGGVGGLAVLAQADGTGWSTLSGLGYNFTGLATGMRFIALGNYKFVRSLVYDGGFLYVLTDTQLDRIDIAASDFATQTLSVTTVATLDDLQANACGTMLNMLISGKFALIGASTGLFRVGNGADMQTAAGSSDVNWTQVAIPDGTNVVQYMQALSDSADPNSFAQGVGNVYINDAYRGYDIAQINRYIVADVTTAPITDTTITPFPDMAVKNILTSWRTYSNFRNITDVDGAALFLTSDRTLVTPTILLNESQALHSTPMPLDLACSAYISAVVRSSASGSLLVAGDFGLRVNE